ncbi:hemin uptake protein HemP [Thiolapillus sp.]
MKPIPSYFKQETPLQDDSPCLIQSHQLFQGGRKELVIVHEEQLYRLRITRHNKLILTK